MTVCYDLESNIKNRQCQLIHRNTVAGSVRSKLHSFAVPLTYPFYATSWRINWSDFWKIKFSSTYFEKLNFSVIGESHWTVDCSIQYWAHTSTRRNTRHTKKRKPLCIKIISACPFLFLHFSKDLRFLFACIFLSGLFPHFPFPFFLFCSITVLRPIECAYCQQVRFALIGLEWSGHQLGKPNP